MAARTCLDLMRGQEFQVEVEVDRYRGLYFASAVGEYHPLYMDEGLARALDMPSSPLPLSYLTSVLMTYLIEWAGDPTCIVELHVKTKSLVFPGDVIRIKGRVVWKSKKKVKVLFQVTNQEGKDITSSCWAMLEFNDRG